MADCVIRRNKLGDVLDGEPLIRRDGDVPDFLAIDSLLLATYEVFEEVDGNLI